MAEGSLQGKAAMVTGAGSPIGLGHAMTLGLVRAGARVALLDVNEDWLAQSAAEMRLIGGEDCALPIANAYSGDCCHLIRCKAATYSGSRALH